jgi:DeoR/GlpR family transcriptional regulator of sugar metabolism
MNKRQAEILGLLKQQDGMSVRVMAEHFRVTPATIRRDLDTLEHEGRLVRDHGSAHLSQAGVVEFRFHEKGRRNSAEKRAIGCAVAELIEAGMTVALDTGTTTLEVARCMADRQNVTVVTTSLAIASVLHSQPGLEIVLLGGVVRKNVPDLTGVLTEENLKKFRVDLAVIGADAVMSDGAYTTDLAIARGTQAMMAGATRKALAADSTKFDAQALYKYAELSAFDVVYTDEGLLPERRKWLDGGARAVAYVDVK